MKTKFLFPALCALVMCLVACEPSNNPNEPNKPDVNKDPDAPQLSMYEIPTTIAGGEYQIQVTSSKVWSAQSNKEWVTMDLNMWTGDAIVKIKVAAGINGDTAMVLFNNEAGSQYLIVYRTIMQGNGGFSVAENKQVKFAPGNLQYQASTNTWRFAANQYDVIGEDNQYISRSYNGWIDLFGWGTGNNPTNTSKAVKDYPTFVDWGRNKIGPYAANTWRTLSSKEWHYLFHEREICSVLYGMATVNGQTGLVVFPDNTMSPVAFKAVMNDYSQNTYSAADWAKLESVGALFLPASGLRNGTDVYDVGNFGSYWSSTSYDEYDACFESFSAHALSLQLKYYRQYGFSVRLAQDL